MTRNLPLGEHFFKKRKRETLPITLEHHILQNQANTTTTGISLSTTIAPISQSPKPSSPTLPSRKTLSPSCAQGMGVYFHPRLATKATAASKSASLRP